MGVAVSEVAGTDAIILAAGQGVRLQGLHDGLPKGLLRVGGTPLIQRSLETLLACGVNRVVLITGYGADAYRRFVSQEFPSVEVRHNPDFARAGSMHSLFMARGTVKRPFLLMESDLLYEPRAVVEMLERPAGDHLLLSGPTGQGDEVYAYGAGGRLLQLSKDRRSQAPLQGEFVGICRLMPDTLEAMCRHYESRAHSSSHYEYDDCLSDLSSRMRFNLHRIDDLHWGEIDNLFQYRRVVDFLLPALEASLPAHADRS